MAITASIIGPTFVTVMMDGTTYTVNDDHTNYARIREALKVKDHELVERLVNVKQSVIAFGKGKVTVSGSSVYYNGSEIKGSVVNRILQMIAEGFDAQPMMNFLGNLMDNPSKRAVDELYGFLEATALPITEDGCFLAYKKVTNDYRDFYTGKMDNSLGKVLEMPRNQVDDERDRTCSYGLHFCSLGYLPHYHGGDGRVMIVKINPADVVSIPSDYNNAKGRACRYEIVGEHAGDERERKEFFTAPVYSTGGGSVAPAAPQVSASQPVQRPSAALSGYNTGRSDASNGRAYNDADPRFSGTDTQRYADSYRKGFNSVSKIAPTASAESDDEAWDRGYEAGRARAESDSDDLRGYDSTPPVGEARHFNEGFETGYEDNYHVDWENAGWERAEQDVSWNRPYDDTPPESCDDESIYREGYANGWRDAKIARI